MPLKKVQQHMIYSAVLTGLSGGLMLGYLLVGMFANPNISHSASQDEAAFQLIGHAFSQLTQMNNPPKDLIYAGIHGMLRTLDPYTQFLESDVFEYMQEQQKGSFYGIGISFDIRNGELLVISAIEGSPAWKLGIKPGDVISEIEGVSTVGITSTDVLNKLRGEKGTKVNITITRPGIPEPMVFDMIRDKIELNSVRSDFKITSGIGYVRLTEFAVTTGKELKESLRKFRQSESGLNGVILDLRFNGGGLLSAAEDVASLFLHEGNLIVSTKGRQSNAATEVRTKEDGEFADVPIIVLINEGSASASEIVAGAIQDHDQGLVIGSTSHGKGLVGSQFPTKWGTAIQITTAQYFTPSNRFIQKPYEIPHRHPRSDAKSSLTFDVGENHKVHYTAKGRKVFGGGGITPDIIVEDPKLSPTILLLENQGAFFDFAIKKEGKLKVVSTDFRITKAIFDEFLDYCAKSELKWTAELSADDRRYIEYALKREIVGVNLGYELGEQIRVRNMVQVQEALKLFPDIKQILASGTTADEPVQITASEE